MICSYSETMCSSFSDCRLYSCSRLTITSSRWPSGRTMPSRAQQLGQALLVGGLDRAELGAELGVLGVRLELGSRSRSVTQPVPMASVISCDSAGLASG
jgi:hypothetical protein